MDPHANQLLNRQYVGISATRPLPPALQPSKISIPPSPPIIKEDHKRENSSPNSVAFLDGDMREGAKVKFAIRKPPLFPRKVVGSEFHCISPSDRVRCESPTAQLRKDYMRRFLSGIEEEDL